MSSLLIKPLAGRFALLSLVGEGGMGTVWKARDLLSKQLVAVKLLGLDVSQPEEVARFEREVGLLAELRHPGIVRYIAHGQADDQAYLVMEWLDGQDLAARLRQKSLSNAEAGTLLRRVAEVLSVAHQHGVIHRDIKPSNLFLRHGRLEETTVLDFGVARRGIAPQRLTRTGVVVGTPEYMAPEQARGLRDITYSADLFALGCVAFEVLTGHQPFSAQHITGLLTKILFEPAPRLRTIRPDLPLALDELIAELLEKDPLRRPPSAAAVLERLSVLPFDASGQPTAEPQQQAESLSDQELQLTTVLLATAEMSELLSGPTVDNLNPQRYLARHGQLLDRLRSIGIHTEVLSDGSLCATTVDAYAATDQVFRAAQAAAILRQELPRWFVVMTTGMCTIHDQLATGPGFEKSQQLLHVALAQDGHQDVWLDALSAELLHTRYHISADPTGAFHLGVRIGESSRRNHQLPLLGFDRELSILRAALHGVGEDEVSRAVLVIGGPGSGKSRLYEELLLRLKEAGDLFSILFTRLESVQAATPFATLVGWLRSVDGPAPGEDSLRPQWQRWLVSSHSQSEAARHIQALSSAMRMSAQKQTTTETTQSHPDREAIVEAFAALLVAASSDTPLLIAVDNIHFIDALSRSTLETVMQRLVDTPILLLGLGRPEIDEMIPHFLEGLPIDRVRIGRMPGKTADKLLQQLGVEPAQRRDELSHDGCGLPQYLLWLAQDFHDRHNRGEQAVIAMMQSRARRLDAQARQVLRAASLLPDHFTQGELLQLLPPALSLSLLDRTLALLIDQEWIERIKPNAPSGEHLLHFRSPLFAKAMLGTLTRADRQLGDRLVAKLRTEGVAVPTSGPTSP